MIIFMNTELYNLREYNNLTQQEVGKILGIGQRTYSSFETGIKIIPLKHLNTLSNYYKVSLDYLLNLNKNKTYQNNIEIKELSRKEIGLRIKEVRKKNNLTLKDLALKLNTTASTIFAYETGKTLILTAFAYQICLNYNVSLDWLCGKI